MTKRDPVTPRDPGVTQSPRDPVTPPIQGGHVGDTLTTAGGVTLRAASTASASQRLSAALAALADAGQTTPCVRSPELFTSEWPEERRQARAWCEGCPVQLVCREAGEGEDWHVWGGIDRAPRSGTKPRKAVAS